MTYGDRKDPRVRFETAMDSVMIAVDGTWRRDCAIADISQTGAKLILKTSMAGLNLREFFLVLTPNGTAYRRCELVRVEGDTIGVRFIVLRKGAKRAPNQRASV
ncbi:PilZ domain-containing protein [Rhodopseudomonas palustris]|uniref:PilZ domain-containing protein n=1 Tax=Rhodopseudomonas palustris TaxID=1076 RepID=UPI00017798BD|nr:PilZ domain-containing protein [Rhodopseudomonas palustris]ACF03266.1 type IV pilus assembly PilZ [Rhodopseudomonas palustris TIE-1]QLH73235.1 PilZ domain-containing protein [Rhodopseudomonas palustris]RIA00372.1 PilZ domain-containing protein [Rhodopseudomonas palustris]WBU29389.1 PilZ domain-containing protein [Rhodopseudomonas palustris]